MFPFTPLSRSRSANGSRPNRAFLAYLGKDHNTGLDTGRIQGDRADAAGGKGAVIRPFSEIYLDVGVVW